MATKRKFPSSGALNDDAALVGLMPSYTIDQFCAAEGFTPTTYFKLRKLGLGPKEMRIASLVRITHRARIDWHRERENPKGAELEAVRAAAENQRARAHAAVKRAVKSPKHVSKRRHGRAA